MGYVSQEGNSKLAPENPPSHCPKRKRLYSNHPSSGRVNFQVRSTDSNPQRSLNSHHSAGTEYVLDNMMLTCEDLSHSLGLKTWQNMDINFLDDLPHLIKHHSPKNRNMLWKNLHKLSITCVCGIFLIPTITKPFRYLNGTLLTYIKIANYKFQGSSILGTCKFLVKQTSSTKLTKKHLVISYIFPLN